MVLICFAGADGGGGAVHRLVGRQAAAQTARNHLWRTLRQAE